ncbi:hypothetical protein [Bacteroides eggerthii]|uniref:hypothetical protein n=1 Tax=Bacteroides eggerthii TaxID=28111 RepID=UPI0022E48590|nr:hypothetical protein [Bacteroides eggerthii]
MLRKNVSSIDTLRSIRMNCSEGFAPANGLVLSPPSGSMSSTTCGVLPSAALVTTNTSSFRSFSFLSIK